MGLDPDHLLDNMAKNGFCQFDCSSDDELLEITARFLGVFTAHDEGEMAVDTACSGGERPPMVPGDDDEVAVGENDEADVVELLQTGVANAIKQGISRVGA